MRIPRGTLFEFPHRLLKGSGGGFRVDRHDQRVVVWLVEDEQVEIPIGRPGLILKRTEWPAITEVQLGKSRNLKHGLAISVSPLRCAFSPHEHGASVDRSQPRPLPHRGGFVYQQA